MTEKKDQELELNSKNEIEEPESFKNFEEELQADTIQEPDKDDKPTDRRPIYITGGCLSFLVIFLVVFGVISHRLYNSFFMHEQLLYSVQEKSPANPFVAVMGVSTNGEDSATLAVEDDGLYINRYISEIGQGFMSKSGRNFVLRHEAPDGRLYLYSDDRSLPTLLSDESISTAWFESFSPNAQLFAYTLINQKENERSVRIVDLVGDELIQINGAVFGTFMPSSDEAIVLEYDDRDDVYTSLVVISIPDGAYNHLIDLDDVNTNPRVFPSPDGKGVYYIVEDQLLYYDFREASKIEVFEFETKEGGIAFFKPDGKSLVIMDPQQDDGQIELLLLDIVGGKITRIDKDVYFRLGVGEKCPQNRCYYGESSIVFSPNGKLLAYSVNQPGNLDLYIAGIDGSNRTRIASKATWFSYKFSPDKKHIVYIEGEQIDRGGDLYIADYDGGNAIKLDSDVWSFQFANGGRKILYFKIDDLDREDPESELLITEPNGEKKERLFPSRDDIFTFIQIP